MTTVPTTGPAVDVSAAENAITTDAGADSSGSEAQFQSMMGGLRAEFEKAQRRNVEMRKLTTEEGTELKVAGKDVQPK